MARVRNLCAVLIAVNLVAAMAALFLVERAARESGPPRGPVLSAFGEATALSPARIEIPDANVRAAVVPVGKLATGEMEMPGFGSAGWYRLGPRPGERGPAVIAAHFDSFDGPDVFYGLRHLDPGDPIYVLDAQGRRIEFVVTAQSTTPKDQLPVARIWGPVAGPALRLITCGGSFDKRTRHYRDNVVVYAQLASASRSI